MIYDNIRECAKKKDLHISELEKRAGLSRGHIGKWKQYEPTIRNLKKVADVLEVSISELIEG